MGNAYSCSIGNVVERWETPAVMAVGELWTKDLADRVAGLVLDRTLCDETAQPLLATLKRNTALLHLSLAHCNLTQDSATRVLTLLRSNNTLLWVDLSGNSIPEATLAEIEGLLAPRRAKQTPVLLIWSKSIPPLVPLHEDGAGVRILALDGGGMRSLAQLRMLASLEKLTGRRITELFDLIAVSGLGSVVALSPAPLADIRALLLRISAEVFSSSPIAGALRSNGWYPPETLAQILSEHLSTRPLLQSGAQPCVCVAVEMADIIAKPHMLRTYPVDHATAPQPPRHAFNATAVQALQAAAATATYFSPTIIDQHPLADASPSLGSVAEHAMLEAAMLWPRAPVKCLLSLGCAPFPPDHYAPQRAAPPPLRARIAAEASHRRLSAWLSAWQPSVAYVRLDPPTPSAARWDETSPAEIAALEGAADAYIASAEVAPVLGRLARQLAEGVRAGPQ